MKKNLVQKLKTETNDKMTSGKENKVVYVPYEATGVLGSLGGIKDLLSGIGTKG